MSFPKQKYLKSVFNLFNVSLILLIVLLPVNFVIAADKMDDDCPIGIKLEANPTEVKSWDSPVNLKVTLNRSYAYNFYCSTKEVATVQYMYNIVGSNQNINLRNATLTIEPNQTGVGSASSDQENQNFDFSQRGAKDDTIGVVVIAYAAITRTAGYKTTTITRTSDPVTIKYNKDTVVPQNTKDTKTTDTKTTDTKTDPTKKEDTGPKGKDNKDINTDVTFKCDPSPCNFDTPLGSFFNPLEDGITVPGIIVRLINILLMISGTVAVGFIIFGGLMMVTGGGNESRVTKGKQTVIYAVAGLVVSILSFSIVAIIQSIIN